MSYQVKKYKHRQSTEQQMIETILKGLWWLISTPFKLIIKKRNPGIQTIFEYIDFVLSSKLQFCIATEYYRYYN